MEATVAQFPRRDGAHRGRDRGARPLKGETVPPEHQVRIALVTKDERRSNERSRRHEERLRRSELDRARSASAASTRATCRRASRETRLTAVADSNAAAGGGDRRRSSTCRAGTATRAELLADPAVDAVVIVSPTHTHRELVIAARRQRASRCSARSRWRCRWTSAATMQARGRAARHVLPDGIHAPVRSRLRGGQAADRRRAHREAGRVQVDVARSVPPEPRVRQPGEQRRHDRRHGHPRFRSRPLVHGRGAAVQAIGGVLAYPGDGDRRRHRQRDRARWSFATAGSASSI